jgi:tRNA 2-thiocytidine biosynthesis protein TtcA
MRRLQHANKRFDLLSPGDRVMVAVSGGKDSWALLDLLREYRRKLPFDFSIVAVNLDQGHPGFPVHVLRDYLESEGHEYRLIAQDTYSVVKANVPEGKAYCSLCSRLRRGVLYDVAESLGATKIALGHHRDDVIETALLNLLWSGQLKAMPARLESDDGRNVIIRPLALCAEADIAEYAEVRGFPIVPCDLCGSQDDLKRQQVKSLLQTLEASNPLVRRSIMAALGNVKPSHLYDPDLRGPARNADRPRSGDGGGAFVDGRGRLPVIE